MTSGPIPKWMTLRNQIYLVNQKQKTVSQRKCSKDSVFLVIQKQTAQPK